MTAHDAHEKDHPAEADEPIYDDQDPREVTRRHPPLHEPDEVPFRRHKDHDAD